MIDGNETQPAGESFFPIATLNKLNGGKADIELARMFRLGMRFRKENALFEVESINEKKFSVVIKLIGVFGQMEIKSE